MRTLMRRRRPSCLALGLQLLLAASVSAQTAPDKSGPKVEQARVAPGLEAWVQELARRIADKDKAIRDSADAALVGVGKPALPALKKLADGKDNEQAKAARALIRRIEASGRGGFPGGFGGPGGFGPGGFGPGGFGGFGGPPRAGEIIPAFLQQMLRLDNKQTKQVQELQKEVDARLAKILTEEQRKPFQPKKGGAGGPKGGPPKAPGGPGAFGPGGFGRGFGPGGFGVSRFDEVKKLIGARDEEWKVISPKLQKVIAARQAIAADGLGAGPGMFFGGPQGGAGSGAVSRARAELKALASDPKHTAADFQEKLAMVREALKSARAELQLAQKSLSALLTADQRKILVGLGYLDYR